MMVLGTIGGGIKGGGEGAVLALPTGEAAGVVTIPAGAILEGAAGAAAGKLWGKALTNVLFSKQSDAVKKAEGLEERVREHLNWLEEEPTSPAANHWRGEVRGWLDQVNKATERMGRRTAEQWQRFVDESLKRLNANSGEMQ
jgi:hypothetical protein